MAVYTDEVAPTASAELANRIKDILIGGSSSQVYSVEVVKSDDEQYYLRTWYSEHCDLSDHDML